MDVFLFSKESHTRHIDQPYLVYFSPITRYCFLAPVFEPFTCDWIITLGLVRCKVRNLMKAFGKLKLKVESIYSPLIVD